MNISNSTSVQAATPAASSDTADAVNILMLKKALDMQTTSATQLLQALPQPHLATEGSVGTKINTFA